MSCFSWMTFKRKEPFKPISYYYESPRLRARMYQQLPNDIVVSRHIDTVKVSMSYRATEIDEIDLKEGDFVLLQCKLKGGWGIGINLTTNKEGKFPLENIAPILRNPLASPLPPPMPKIRIF